ncbi:putative toxin-antitoxin system toxin component, PIN family [Candidatus Deferrimicrobium sp.]|uniref:putative toxin-antitoxin system toxin component, PIN family n=1 Tax=Candidatus Deferrimicrobium sp. TaxID=3060586 RepID=UPI0027281174|nr:putative toxin-antitoxin system toxin component, PIN family [Candidatus Deferrimicrobium sp.]MDO8739844.1 putative toxin-antitoxin system toxin component, PIN family [Candidatus Deferrimicrobium sp.]
MRVVLDANVYISALLVGRGCEEILTLGRTGVIEVLSSPEIIDEVASVLRRKFHWSPSDIRSFLDEASDLCRMIPFDPAEVEFPADPADAKILACGVAGKADVIVTGDKKHLLPLKRYRGIPIVSPAEFLEQIG